MGSKKGIIALQIVAQIEGVYLHHHAIPSCATPRQGNLLLLATLRVRVSMILSGKLKGKVVRLLIRLCKMSITLISLIHAGFINNGEDGRNAW